MPMLPVVRGETETARQILFYSLALVAFTLVPVATQTFGWVYAVAAVALGARFVHLALRLRAQPSPARARPLFTYSLAYLALLYVAMAVDPLVLA